jgi:hypothetical protein
MRTLAIALILASLAVPVFAAEDPNKEEQSRVEQQKKKESAEIESAYKDMLKRTSREQPAKKDLSDPWRGTR